MHMRPICKRSEMGLSKPTNSSSSPGISGGKRNAATVIGPDLTIKGDLVSTGELQVDGEVHGDIRGTRVVIGKRAHITGGIIGEEIVICGQVTGTVRGRVVTLQSASHVKGDIFHRAFAMEHGASFEGSSHRSDDPLAGLSTVVPTLNGSGDSGLCDVGVGPPRYLCSTDQHIFLCPTFTPTNIVPTGVPVMSIEPSLARLLVSGPQSSVPLSKSYVPLGDHADLAPIPFRVPPLVSQSCAPHRRRRVIPPNIPEPLAFGMRRPPERGR